MHPAVVAKVATLTEAAQVRPIDVCPDVVDVAGRQDDQPAAVRVRLPIGRPAALAPMPGPPAHLEADQPPPRPPIEAPQLTADWHRLLPVHPAA